MHIHEAFPADRAEFSFAKTIGAFSRNMSDMMDEGDIPDILLSQIAEMMECEAKAPDISHMDFLYDEITGAWGMDFVSSSPLFSTTPPFFEIFILIIPFSKFS